MSRPVSVPVLEGRNSNFIVDEVNFNDCVDIWDFFALAVSPMVQKLAESNTKEENGGGTNAKPTPDAKDAMGKPNNLVNSSAPDPFDERAITTLIFATIFNANV